MPNPGFLAPDCLVLMGLYFHVGVRMSLMQCGEETLVQSQPWLSHQLSEEPGKSLDLCLSVSWTPLLTALPPSGPLPLLSHIRPPRCIPSHSALQLE